MNLILSAIPGGRCCHYSQLTAGRTEAWKGQIAYEGLSATTKATQATVVSRLVTKPACPYPLRWAALGKVVPGARVLATRQDWV